jgi:hypothetical protein
MNEPGRRPRQATVLGGLLILVGAVLLLGQLLRIDVGRYGWPLFVIVPGALILVVAVTVRGVVSEGLAIAGSSVTMAGLILFYQNATDRFESWAYAWALIFPSATGIGMILYGVTAGRPGNVRFGTRLLGAGVVIFVLGAVFFEGILGIGGYHFGRSAGIVVGAVIIAIGAVMFTLNLISDRPRGPGLH